MASQGDPLPCGKFRPFPMPTNNSSRTMLSQMHKGERALIKSHADQITRDLEVVDAFRLHAIQRIVFCIVRTEP
jgi:hypothetical protein